MKKSSKVLAVILAFAMTFTTLLLPVYAATDVSSDAEQMLYKFVDKLVDALVNGISAIIPDPDWVDVEDYESKAFYAGSKEFIDAPEADAQWKVGYSNASIQTGKELDGNHYVGGSLSVTKKVATKILDDQKVRTVAISDGRGISIFSVIDSYGLANSNVQIIRERFQKYADEKGLEIVSVNVSTLHQHSCIDTFGMNGDILGALFLTPMKNLLGIEAPNGQNKEFMENLYSKTVDSMIEAVDNMETGKLYYGSVDIAEYIYDKRDPQVFDPELHRLRFVPDNAESEETWIVNGAIHCVGFGAGPTEITGDYPYFMEKYINENHDANFIFIQGAELAITTEKDNIVADPEYTAVFDEGYGKIAAYAKVLVDKLGTITDEEEVAPIFNIAIKEIIMPVENSILIVAANGGLLTNNVLKDGLFKYKLATEIGYCEFGTNLAVALMPGELAPEIAFGGAMAADDEYNWTGDAWDFEPMNEACGNKEFIVFGLTNDQVGYILTDNNYHSYFTENEEIVSTGKNAGSIITDNYYKLLDEIAA